MEKKRSKSYARTKGHSFEREIAIELREIFPHARRQLEYHARDAKGIDIANTGDFKIQCKKLKRYASVNTILEVQCDKSLGDIPVLITAGDNQPKVAVLYFDDFLRMVKAVVR